MLIQCCNKNRTIFRIFLVIIASQKQRFYKRRYYHSFYKPTLSRQCNQDLAVIYANVDVILWNLHTMSQCKVAHVSSSSVSSRFGQICVGKVQDNGNGSAFSFVPEIPADKTQLDQTFRGADHVRKIKKEIVMLLPVVHEFYLRLFCCLMSYYYVCNKEVCFASSGISRSDLIGEM